MLCFRTVSRMFWLIATLSVLPAASASTQGLPPAVVKLREKAERGDLAAQEKLGFLFAYGRDVPKDLEAAKRWLKEPADAGRPLALIHLAYLYGRPGGTQAEHEKAFELNLYAANQGYAIAQSNIGAYYYFGGGGVERGWEAAVRWLEPAAAQGYVPALNLLYSVFAEGHDIERDLDRALKYALRSAQLGNFDGQFAAADLLLRKESARDRKVGKALLIAAANSTGFNTNRGLARFRLAVRYYTQSIGDQYERSSETVKWLNAALEDKFEAARIMLAVCYWNGVGVISNADRAQELFEQALPAVQVFELNNIAWLLAVHPNDNVRDGALAVRIMQYVVEKPNERTAAHLDTLAAAYAELGEFELAKKAQIEAINAASATRMPLILERFKQRLALYNTSRAHRELF
jgi:TPR repeat protein